MAPTDQSKHPDDGPAQPPAPGEVPATAAPDFAGELLTGSPRPTPTEHGPLIELDALLGKGTRYQGKLYFDGRVRIEGCFEGPIAGDGVLVIADSAEVTGDIEVSACIVVGGTVRGHVRARDAIELHAPAAVHGDLHAPNIFIDRGATFEGNCRMAPLAAPSSDTGDGAAEAAATPAAREPETEPR